MKKDFSGFSEDIQMFLQNKKEMIDIYREMQDGYMKVLYYSVLPGICLAYNDIHTTVVPVFAGLSFEDSFIVNYCLEGRCEFHLSDDTYSYIDKGCMSVSTWMVQDSFYYPSGFYQGWEIYVFPNAFTDETRQVLKLFGIDFGRLSSLYEKSLSCITPEPFLSLWNMFLQNREGSMTGNIRLVTLQLLLQLGNRDILHQSSQTFLTRTQSALAKKARDILMKDLSRHISARLIAASLGVSETSLKNYFRFVYGMNISTFLNNKRMELAADLLAGSDMNISDIARACGYVNQGRFAKVFRDFYHMKPLDYRRSKKIHAETGNIMKLTPHS